MKLMKAECAILVAALLIGNCYHGAVCHMLGNDPTRRAEYVDPEGKYLLEWEPLWSLQRIIFNVTVQTRGFVAFGLSNNGVNSGGMDVLIAGVFNRGKAYFLDHHIGDNRGRTVYPRLDPSQDYTLHEAWESQTHTFISFSRSMDTCDPHDYPITDNKVSLVWAYGENDDHEVSWRYSRMGSYDLYLLDSDYSPKIVRDPSNIRGGGEPRISTEEKLKTWTISSRVRIPSNSTSYLCSMYRGPSLPRKHHVVGFDVHIESEQSRQRLHHLIVFKCNAPQGLNSGIFEPFVGDGQSQTCYITQQPSNDGPMPTHFCSEFYLGWAVGGRSFFTPPHVGFPLAASPNEYYMVQVHYDNPQQQSQLVDFRMDFFYTAQLRPNDGGVMAIGHDIPGLASSMLIPPNSVNHQIHGHCSPECTQRMYPAKVGIKVFAAILHSHLSGRRMRLRHFNRTQEHPWILYDDNYSNSYQQFRHLHQERRILPGDQLTMECTYDSTWNNGSSVVGGFATQQEMCLAFIVYYNRISDYTLCRSEIVSDEYRQHFLGVGNVTWLQNQLDWVATGDNRQFAGLTAQQLSDSYVNWSKGRRRELQRFHEVHPHVGKCSRELYARSPTVLQALMQSGQATQPLTNAVPMNVNTPDDFSGIVGYPHRIRAYIPPKTCSYRAKHPSYNNKRFYQ